MKNIKRMIAVAVLMLGAVAAFAQSYGHYEVRWGKVYYGNMELRDADSRTIQDLGYGYAKDRNYVYWNGQVLPYVDPTYFRLNDRYADRPPVHHVPGGKPGKPGHNDRYDNYGYVVTGNAVLFNGRLVTGARASSFKDLGWGYAKDSFDVYYCGEKISGASTSSFKVLKDGYARDSFDAYYLGKKIKGASAGSFKALEDGYAKDSFSIYYLGVKVEGAWVSSFKVLGNGYAQDAFNTYYLGRKIN